MWVTLIILIVLVGGYFLFLHGNSSKINSEKTGATSLSECQNAENNIERDECYAQVAAATGDFSICENTGSFPEFCYRELAGIMKDESICEDKIDPIDFSSYEKCFWNVAVAKEDFSLCEGLSEFDGDCILDVARKRQKLSECNELEGKNDFQECVYGVAAGKNDRSICEETYPGDIFPNEDLRERCLKYVSKFN